MRSVSVIIPFYNSSKTILRALDSVVRQTEQPKEVILVDDGSKDDSIDIVQQFIKENKQVKFVLIRKSNGGVSSARNAGIIAAGSEFIAFLDSDDEWLSNKLELQLNLFKEHSDFDLLGGLITKSNHNERTAIKEISLSKLIFKNYFQPSTVMLRRSVADSIGLFDETQRYAEEGNYFMRVANKHKCGLIMEQLVIYDQGKSGFGDGGLSANLVEMEKGELKNLKFAVQNGYITNFKYGLAVIFSILKYFRRILIVRIR